MLALAVAAAAIALPLARAADSGEAPPVSPTSAGALPVRVAAAVEVDSYEQRKLFTGVLVARRRSQLAFERPGKLVELLVDEGQAVEAGQPLARLDQRRLAAQQRRAEAELAEAAAVMTELEHGPRKETIATAAAEVRSLTAQRDLAMQRLRRDRKLVDTAAISREKYDESYYAAKAAEAQLNASAKRLEELKAGSRAEEIEAQRARVAALEARLEDVRREVEDATLTAPYAGSITRRRLDEGDVVAAGAPIFDLVESSRLEAWVGVPADAAAQLRPGQTVPVTVGDQQGMGRVRSVRAELDPTTRTRNVVVEIAPKDHKALTAGQVARIELNETIEQQGIWVPASALTPHRRGVWAVYVAEGEGADRTVARRDVELLHTEGERSFVRGTLQRGELVVVAGGHKIVPGQQVAVAKTAAPTPLAGIPSTGPAR